MANLAEEFQTSARRGMNDSSPTLAYQDDEAALLLNYRVTPDGRAKVRYGTQRTHTNAQNAGAQGYGGIEFTTAAGVKQWIVFVGDKMYVSDDYGVLWSEEATGLRQDYWSLVTFNTGAATYLLCANGGANSYKWDGTTWSTIANIRSGTKYLAVHNERLWAYATGALVEASKIRDPETWASPDGLDLYVVTHDGDAEITGLYSVGPFLMVFKRKSVAYIEGYGSSDVIVGAGARGVSRTVGCIAPRTVCGVDGTGVMWLSERGFEYYQPGGEPVVVSASVENYLAGMSRTAVESEPNLPVAYYDSETRSYEAWIPASGQTQNTFAFVYRAPVGEAGGCVSFFTAAVPSGGYSLYVDASGFLQMESGSARSQGTSSSGFLALAGEGEPGVYAELPSGFLTLASTNTGPAAAFVADFADATSRPVHVGNDGYVRRSGTGAKDDVLSDGSGGVAIGDRYRTRPIHFNSPFTRKRGRVIRVRVESATGVSPVVALVADGVEGTAHTLSIDASAGQAGEAKARVSGRGRVLQVEVRSAGAGTEVGAVAIAAEILAERP